jgi:filamentous hemagglutinin
MSAGATFANTHQLRPGIALSPAQVAQLTSDIVWLEAQTVRLPDGTTTTVLAPRVYLAPRSGDFAANGQLVGGGAVISAAQVKLALGGDVNNSGTIAGRQLVAISAQNIGNSGLIQGDIALLNARQNIDIQGGQVQAHTGMLVQAGGDINITTTTQSSQNTPGANSFSQTGIDRVAGLYVSAPAGILLASAGGNIDLSAAQIVNAGSGPTSLSAGGSVNLGTVQVEQSQDINWNATNYQRQSSSAEVGTQISGAGAVAISAQNDVNLRAAQVNASGALIVDAGGNVNVEAGQSAYGIATATQEQSRCPRCTAANSAKPPGTVEALGQIIE